MSRKIGQELVARGVITETQLQTALSRQLVHGGHLGTCLIEAACIDEMQLGHVLSEVLGFPHATPQLFASIPSPVIETVPAALAERTRVVPIGRDGRTLRLALMNPKDLATLDEVAFATSCKVEPWIAPEVRIAHALERYYGVARSRRFILLSQATPIPRPAAVAVSPPVAPEPAPSPPVAAAPPPPEPAAQQPVVAQPVAVQTGVASPSAPPSAPPVAAAQPAQPAQPAPPAPAAAPAEKDAALQYGSGPSVAEQWAALEGDKAADSAAPAAGEEEALAAVGLWEQIREEPEYEGQFFRRPGNVDRPQLQVDFQQLAMDLFAAQGPEDVPRAVFDTLGDRVDRKLLFTVEGLNARIWDWSGFSLSPESVREFRFDVTREPLLDLVAGSDIFFGGRPNLRKYADFYHRLELDPPQELMLMPLYVHSRLVALMYVDGGMRDKIPGSQEDYKRIGRKIEVALKIFTLKRKLLLV